MGNTLGCLALVLAASGPAAPPDAKPEITYRFQMVEVRGLSWRGPGRDTLRPVAHNGAVSVWTAPGDFLEWLPKEARGAVTADAKVHGPAQSPAHLTTRKEQAFVTQVSWKGKGKPPRQITENIREGVAATVIGRKLDQGVLVQLVIDDTDIRSVHTIDVPGPKKVAKLDASARATSVEVSASMEPGDSAESLTRVDLAEVSDSDSDCAKCCPYSFSKSETARDSETSQSGWAPSKPEAVAGKAKTDAQAARAGFKASSADSQIQLPEIGRASAAGEWLIPEDGVLVIGFGPHTVADADGKAVVREHLAVITAEAEEGELSDAEALASPPPIATPSEPAPATTPVPPRTAAAIPSLPSRTLPQGLHLDGTPSVLPPLPDEEKDAAPADDSKSDEPLPSPQSKRPAAAGEAATPLPLPRLPVPDRAPTPTSAEPKAKKVDHKAAKALFSLPPLSQFKPSSLLPFPLPGAQFLLPLKAFGMKLPFNQKLEFELLGRIVPDPDAAAEEQVVAVGN